MTLILSTCANQVLQEFGGAMPENLLGFEDAMREFLAVRALELQKLGISGTDKTVTSTSLAPTVRDAALPGGFGDITPAFVQLADAGDSTGNTVSKVEIVPIEDIADYEGARAISFYGNPMRYRLAWDAWLEGTVYVWSNPILDLSAVTETTVMTFPPAFWTLLYKKTARNLVRIATLKIAFQVSDDPGLSTVAAALAVLLDSLSAQTVEWEREFRKYTNLDLNAQPHLRRSIEERWARGVNDITIG